MKKFLIHLNSILVQFLIYFKLNNLLSFSGSTTYRGRGSSSSYRGSGERSGRGRGATRGGRGGYSSSTGRGSTSRDGGRFNTEKSPDGKVGRTLVLSKRRVSYYQSSPMCLKVGTVAPHHFTI